MTGAICVQNYTPFQSHNNVEDQLLWKAGSGGSKKKKKRTPIFFEKVNICILVPSSMQMQIEKPSNLTHFTEWEH